MRRRLLKRIEGLPGVRLASVASRTPLTGGARSISVSLDGRPLDSKQAPEADYSLVTPDYFETLGIPILRGRNFTQQEVGDGGNFDGAPVIVSDGHGAEILAGPGPHRQAHQLRNSGRQPEFSGRLHLRSASSVVIGVAKDIRTERVDKFDETCVYLPAPRTFNGSIVVRPGRRSEAGGGGIARRARRDGLPPGRLSFSIFGRRFHFSRHLCCRGSERSALRSSAFWGCCWRRWEFTAW